MTELSDGQVHIWGIALDDTSANTSDRLRDILSDDERIRASRFIHGRYGDMFVAARGYMRTILGFYLDTSPGEIRFEYLRHGKPLLSKELNPANLTFNLSHSRSLALLAVTVKREIGIDVEYPRPVLRAEKILERFFSDGERDYYHSHSEAMKERAFMNLWTIKEAYSKALGRGISSDLRGIDLTEALSCDPHSGMSVSLEIGAGELWTIHRLHPDSPYIAALALNGNISVIHHYDASRLLP